jgi:hypothetical protein
MADLSRLNWRIMGFDREPRPRPKKEERVQGFVGVVRDEPITGEANVSRTPRPSNETDERIKAPEQKPEDQGMADGETMRAVSREHTSTQPKTAEEPPLRVRMGIQSKPAVRERGETFRENTAPRDDGGPVRGR